MSYYVIIRGPLGIGKSTVAKKLADDIGAEYISIDEILEKNKLDNERAEDGYIPESNFLRANGLILPEVKRALSSGKPVIFDGNFYRKSQIDDLVGKLDKWDNYAFTLKAPLELCIKRDAGRKEPHGIGAATVVYKITTKFDYGTVIDVVGKTPDEIVEEVISNLP